MTRKIYKSILLAAAAVLLASLVIIMGFMYDYFGDVQQSQLRDELSLAAAAVEDDGAAYLERLSADRFRLTWIAPDGTVLYDTQADAGAMENHADRSEVRDALSAGEGESTRYSSTLLGKTVYCARRLGDGSVLRISVGRVTMGALALGMLRPILIVLVIALLLSWALGSRLAKRVAEPLNRLDLEHPLDNDAYEELAPLLNRINRQHHEISAQLRMLERQRREFEQITGSMQEGLVLLDGRGAVLSINPAAQGIFGTDGSCVGKDFLTLDRSRGMSAALQRAAEDGHSEMRTERAGRVYLFDMSRTEPSGDAPGTVMIAFDVTEREFAERNRREFTANVSHELKTPLQGIIGSAELLENGMVKAEDAPRFIGHIRTEAARMVTLIGDIIRLSQLDEGQELPREDVDVLEAAREAAESLRGEAAAKNVRVSVTGQPAVMCGVRRLLYEIIYNLCDNAIKYNRDGGSVTADVADGEESVCVTVSGTGIGIPPEHQDRVFERFYRVDKSHSKASGGTGLGLSIVKHAVQYHRGRISLKSEPGRGTAITVTFPKQ